MQSNNSTIGQQRQAIYKHLAAGNPLSTLYAREHLGICHPAGRIQELRGQGHDIITAWRVVSDVTGKKHKVAEYSLFNSRATQCHSGARVTP